MQWRDAVCCKCNTVRSHERIGTFRKSSLRITVAMLSPCWMIDLTVLISSLAKWGHLHYSWSFRRSNIKRSLLFFSLIRRLLAKRNFACGSKTSTASMEMSLWISSVMKTPCRETVSGLDSSNGAGLSPIVISTPCSIHSWTCVGAFIFRHSRSRSSLSFFVTPVAGHFCWRL